MAPGWNMERKYGFPLCPPVPMMIALRAPDGDGRPLFLDQALGPFAAGEFAVADKLLARDGILSRREARPDADHAAGELALADDLVHVAVEDELDALLFGAQLQGPGDRGAPRQDARPAFSLPVVHDTRREAAGAHRELGVSVPSGVLLRDHVPRLDVGDSPHFEHRRRAPRAGQAAKIVRAVDAREFHVVVQEELPDRDNVVGPRTHHFPVVVPVWRPAAGVHDRPIDLIPEQKIGIVGHCLVGFHIGNRDQPLRVALSGEVAFLDGVAGAEGDVAVAVDHAAADVEVLIDNDHRRAEVAGADGGGEPHGSASEDDDIRFVVPGNGLGLRGAGRRDAKRSRANTDCGAPA